MDPMTVVDQRYEEAEKEKTTWLDDMDAASEAFVERCRLTWATTLRDGED